MSAVLIMGDVKNMNSMHLIVDSFYMIMGNRPISVFSVRNAFSMLSLLRYIERHSSGV